MSEAITSANIPTASRIAPYFNIFFAVSSLSEEERFKLLTSLLRLFNLPDRDE
ncbi:hypothetical protein HC928_11615 [bacterium]|nr:hypothetical protein [bacterium]